MGVIWTGRELEREHGEVKVATRKSKLRPFRFLTTEERITAPFPFTADCQDPIGLGVSFTLLTHAGDITWTETVCDEHLADVKALAEHR